MQTCFFALSGVLPREQAIERIKKAVAKKAAPAKKAPATKAAVKKAPAKAPAKRGRK